MRHHDVDLFVIGAGSGGVRAGRVCAKYGARVAIAEEHRVGGTCVIRGCVPKKLLVYGAHFAQDLADAQRFGWTVGDLTFDWTVLRDNVASEVTRLEGIYTGTLRDHGVEIFHERARVSGPNQVTLASGRTLSAGKILIATGAWPEVPPIPGHELAITSNEIFHLEALPKRIVVAGAGYIALEFAGIFNELGTRVTVVNRTDTILRAHDAQIRDRLVQLASAKGITFRFHTSITRIEKREEGALRVHHSSGDPVDCDSVLFATGRRANTRGLGLESAAVALDASGAIKVDADSRTSCPTIFAVGDVTHRVQLTPVAIREGHAFADTQFGNKPRRVDYDAIPSAVFSHPPIASVGLTETEAKQRYGSAKVFTSDFRPMKNVIAARQERALYKLVVHPSTDVVLGVHMIGPDAPEILQAAAIAVRARLTKAQYDETVALHPTMAEELVLMG